MGTYMGSRRERFHRLIGTAGRRETVEHLAIMTRRLGVATASGRQRPWGLVALPLLLVGPW